MRNIKCSYYAIAILDNGEKHTSQMVDTRAEATALLHQLMAEYEAHCGDIGCYVW